jgi:hypothetical protein
MMSAASRPPAAPVCGARLQACRVDSRVDVWQLPDLLPSRDRMSSTAPTAGSGINHEG